MTIYIVMIIYTVKEEVQRYLKNTLRPFPQRACPDVSELGSSRLVGPVRQLSRSSNCHLDLHPKRLFHPSLVLLLA